MRFRTVLFDLDGTLIDHFSAIHRCHAYAMRRLGLPELQDVLRLLRLVDQLGEDARAG